MIALEDGFMMVVMVLPGMIVEVGESTTVKVPFEMEHIEGDTLIKSALKMSEHVEETEVREVIDVSELSAFENLNGSNLTTQLLCG